MHWLGEVPYEEALALQERLRSEVLAGRSPGALLLLEHPHSVTIGRHGNRQNVLAPELLERAGCRVFHVARGGDVTYHGPGQLVGYPIVSLSALKLGVRAYVETLAEILTQVVSEWGVEAVWDPDNPGLWVGRDKLAAFGVHVHRQVTNHGFALNVDPALELYDLIIPCGLRDRGVTSLSRLLGPGAPSLLEVRERVAVEFARQLNFEYNPAARVQVWSVDSCEGESRT